MKNPNFKRNDYYINSYMLSHYNPHEEEIRYRLFLTVGSRGRGKTYSAKNYITGRYLYDKSFQKFAWIRLTDSACQNLLENNGSTFFENSILKKRKIDISTSGSDIFFKRTFESDDKYVHKGKVLSLQNYYAWKGNQFDDYDVLIVDELVRAESERKTFDIPKAFINTLETIIRERPNVLVLIYANAINEMQEIRKLFGFMPLPGNFGVYKLYHKRAMIEYLDDSKEWKARKAQTIAGRLATGLTEFTNKHDDPMAELDVFTERKNVPKKRYVMSLKLNNTPMWYDLFEHKGKYYLDYKTYSPTIHGATYYALHRSLVNNNFRYSPEVYKFIKSLWDNNKLLYPGITQYNLVQSLILLNKPLKY